MAVKKEGSAEQKELLIKFKDSITVENSTRLVVLLCLVAFIQVAMATAEAVGLLEWDIVIFWEHVSNFLFCMAFASVLFVLKKTGITKKKVNAIAAIMIVNHLLILYYGIFATIVLFSAGMQSFSIFFIAATVVNLTHVRWIQASGLTVTASYICLSIYIYNTFETSEFFIWDVVLFFVVLVAVLISNYVSYRSRRITFMNEVKISDMNKKLSEMSEIDELTGLFNRRKILETLDYCIDKSKKDGCDFSLVMIDLDHFKQINDRFGHNAGDIVLEEFSVLMSKNLRKDDIFGRWGGEEFIIIMPQSKKEEAFALIDRIRGIVINYDFKTIGKMTFSAGICEFIPEYNDDKLIANADFAMYLSKQMGRNKVSIYEASA